MGQSLYIERKEMVEKKKYNIINNFYVSTNNVCNSLGLKK